MSYHISLHKIDLFLFFFFLFMHLPSEVWEHITNFLSGDTSYWKRSFTSCLRDIHNAFIHDLLLTFDARGFKVSHVMVHHLSFPPKRYIYFSHF